MKKSFVGIMGVVFIVLGVLGAIGIMLSFDWEEWNFIKDMSLSQSETIAFMAAQRNETLIMAFLALVGNLAIGSVLLALDKIIGLLQSNKQEVDKSE